MSRWEPDACGRLTKAAMELFQERGYPRTTVADIAARAGLTERTFFRYFNDKREVLFSGSQELEQLMVDAVAAAPAGSAPLQVVAGAVEAAGARLQELRDPSAVRARHALVTAHAELRERELIKMAALAAAITRGLHARGVPEPIASIAAEAGITIFKVGFERWVSQDRQRDFVSHIRDALATLKTVTGEAGKAAPRRKKTRAPAR